MAVIHVHVQKNTIEQDIIQHNAIQFDLILLNTMHCNKKTIIMFLQFSAGRYLCIDISVFCFQIPAINYDTQDIPHHTDNPPTVLMTHRTHII